jgi:hypothetical protein
VEKALDADSMEGERQSVSNGQQLSRGDGRKVARAAVEEESLEVKGQR